MKTPTYDMNPIIETLTSAIDRLQKLCKHPKTVLQILDENLSTSEFTNACHNITVAQANSPCDSILSAIDSISWASTKEGRDYWADIYSRFE